VAVSKRRFVARCPGCRKAFYTRAGIGSAYTIECDHCGATVPFPDALGNFAQEGEMFNYEEKTYAVTVPCKHCNGTGSVQDVSQWPPFAVCPGCKGAGVHVLIPDRQEKPSGG
jgi:DnaJ-class molecular chaperone